MCASVPTVCQRCARALAQAKPYGDKPLYIYYIYVPTIIIIIIIIFYIGYI
nr:MAG TPA: protein of unknown function DUF2116 [Caudoviricetes sp.]